MCGRGKGESLRPPNIVVAFELRGLGWRLGRCAGCKMGFEIVWLDRVVNNLFDKAEVEFG